ncbi:hypothetical protein F0562_026835 [Nyssa sinensis]|uniref:Zinc finger CHCC-type domain-containing protein n=1 Tax=Nyssa sinensis TaxID=561372 RepID=A0A5J5BAG2_9ASTE|nr:hypothetical protein F0562_026835 [Nyssa sinensis]
MAACGRKYGYVTASNLIKTLTRSTTFVPNWRSLSGIVSSEIISSHTEKWMQVERRIVAFEIDTIPALGHPIEFIRVDLKEPAVCKYCGLRDVQDHGDRHH